MNENPVVRDERTLAVEDRSFRFAYTLLVFGLLLDIAYRLWVQGKLNWDLMALVVVSVILGLAYQATKKTLPHRWWHLAIVLMRATLIAVLTGFVVWLVRRH